MLVCSLTRSAASEVAGRRLPIPRNAVGTLHSMAYRSIGSPDVAESHMDDWNEHNPQYRMSGGKLDVDEAGWDRAPGAAPGDPLLAALNLLRARMIPRDRWAMRIKQFDNAWYDWKTVNRFVDFTDMIEQALQYHAHEPPGEPDVIIADEAQDHSALEYSLLRAWGDAAGALIATGDPFQSLYCWRGAHPELFVDPEIPDDHKMVLSQSYRIPRAVHAHAMRWIRQLSDFTDIQYRPRDADGEIVRLSDATWTAPERAVDLAEKYLADGKSVMFQASCGYMLAPTIAVLRRRGMPFSNPWRKKHGGWNPLARRGTSLCSRMLNFLRPDVGTYGQDARPWTYEELDSWTAVVKASGTIRRGCKSEISNTAHDYPGEIVTDKQISQWLDERAWSDLRSAFECRDTEMYDGNRKITIRTLVRWWTSRLLAAKAGPVDYLVQILAGSGADALTKHPRCHVGTVHSFKGGEADCCFLYPDVSPAGWAEWNSPGPSRDSVIRLFYVGMTRARESLVLCGQAGGCAVDLR